MSKARDLANAGTALTTVSATELGYLDGVTSAVQTQIDSKLATTTASSTYEPVLPSQTGNSGKYLTTNGSTKSWGTVASGQLQEVAFTSSNASWTIPTGVTGVWALVVGGGGGGGASATATAANSGGGGGAGQVLEKYIAISGDTTLNITIGSGGAGATTSGARGSNGSTSSIVGNTSATTYASAAGGGGGGGGAAANVAGLTGASGGGRGDSTNVNYGGGGGGFSGSAHSSGYGFFDGSVFQTGAGIGPTTLGITGTYGGRQDNGTPYGGQGILIWNRALAGGGNGPVGTVSNMLSTSYGAVGTLNYNNNQNNATANTGAGGNGASCSANVKYNGGSGASGIVVLRYVG